MIKGYLKKIEYRLVRDRAVYETTLKISNSKDTYNLFKYLEDSDRENLVAVYLDGGNKILAYEIVTVGSINKSLAPIRQVIKGALLCNATGIIMVHNHPSGDPYPSYADDKFTRELRNACKLFEICLLDHVIIGFGRYQSYANLHKI